VEGSKTTGGPGEDDDHDRKQKEESDLLENTLGRLVVEDERSRYISSTSSANLTDQVRCHES